MKIKKKKLLTLSEQIAEQIKEAIIEKQVKPGDKLPPEQDLAEQFQVSRPTIRDAIKLLSTSKLVVTKPGSKGGHFVSEMDPDSFVSDFSDYITLSLSLKGITLEEVIEMRKMIEIKACGLAAAYRTKQDLINLKKTLPPKNSPISDQLYFNQDFQFHRAIAKATHNRLIMINVEAITLSLSPYFQAMDCSLQLKTDLTKELHDIFQAIEQQKPEHAEEKMAYHLRHFISYFSSVNLQSQTMISGNK